MIPDSDLMSTGKSLQPGGIFMIADRRCTRQISLHTRVRLSPHNVVNVGDARVV